MQGSPSRTWTIEVPQTCCQVASSERTGQTARALNRSCSGWPAAWVGVGGGGIALGEPDGTAGEEDVALAAVGEAAGLFSPPQPTVSTRTKTPATSAKKGFIALIVAWHHTRRGAFVGVDYT